MSSKSTRLERSTSASDIFVDNKRTNLLSSYGCLSKPVIFFRLTEIPVFLPKSKMGAVKAARI